MVRITLLKVGRKHSYDFRIVVREARSAPRSGRYIEHLGTYNTKTKTVSLKKDRIEWWLSHGAKSSGTVHNLFVRQGLVRGPKISVTPRFKQMSHIKEAETKKEEEKKQEVPKAEHQDVQNQIEEQSSPAS